MGSDWYSQEGQRAEEDEPTGFVLQVADHGLAPQPRDPVEVTLVERHRAL